MQHSFLYLVAVLDWYSRYVLAWELSNTLDTDFCLVVLEAALAHGRPEIFNTDQGVQFTSVAYTSRLEAAGIQISRDGRGRALDNVFALAALALGHMGGGVPQRLPVGRRRGSRARPLLPFL
jgi:putative transposase